MSQGPMNRKPHRSEGQTKSVQPLLRVDQVGFSYALRQVLNDVSFEVVPGKFTAIIGPNGCGKTTLVKLLLKSLSPDTGQIRFMGENLGDFTNKDLARRMAAVLQVIDPAPMTVRDYVLLGRMPFFTPFQFFESEKDREIAEHYMALTGVSHLADEKISQVSGGEKQLCAIARALAQEPELILLDEPTAHLDITHQKRILDLMTDLKERLSLTVLMVLHDLNLAGEYADRLVLLQPRSGRLGDPDPGAGFSSVFSCGRPDQVLTREAINRVYRTRVEVHPNPVSGSPWVLLTRESHKGRVR